MGKIAGLLCSLYLSAGYMEMLPTADNYEHQTQVGYSRRLRHQHDQNAIANALAGVFAKKKLRREPLDMSPEGLNSLLVEVRAFPKVSDELTLEELLAIWASVYEVDRAK